MGESRPGRVERSLSRWSVSCRFGLDARALCKAAYLLCNNKYAWSGLWLMSSEKKQTSWTSSDPIYKDEMRMEERAREMRCSRVRTK
jgi:hypothetical protein